MSTAAPRLPGDRGHLARLLDVWARDTAEPVTSGRLRRLVGVTVGDVLGVCHGASPPLLSSS